MNEGLIADKPNRPPLLQAIDEVPLTFVHPAEVTKRQNVTPCRTVVLFVVISEGVGILGLFG
ncbi:MAG: hypothetical protein R3C49_17955 [Planctomycetaceae bacterium]